MKYFIYLLLFVSLGINAQTTKKVCFLGNSYTYVNDLPQLISDLATADGNTLIKDQNTPGGYTLMGHSTNPTSLNKISFDTWDYVVLQDQSQLPSFPWNQVVSDVIPYAEILVDSIRSANECAIPLFFNTWGRRDGDSQWDSIDTFTEMNQRLYNTYSWLANENSGKLSPVGIGFEHIANDLGSPIPFTNLYAGDGSHPSIYGSYLAACIFYELIFEQSPLGNTFFPGTISMSDATYLQNVANYVVNDVDSVSIEYTQPVASFIYTIVGNTVTFTNTSQHAFDYLWDFGDGNTSTEINPSHTYLSTINIDVNLNAIYCSNSDDTTQTIQSLNIQKNNKEDIFIYPNPSKIGYINILNSASNDQIEIYSMDGKLIMSHTTSGSTSTKIYLNPGVYLIKTSESISKVIIQ